MRLFLAIELSERARGHLSTVAQGWRGQWRQRWPRVAWVREENLHVTLKFLGAVPETDLAPLCEALNQTARPGVIRLFAQSVRCFPHNRSPRIITAVMTESAPQLEELYVSIEDACAKCGFGREQRKYRPHVTLGRARVPLPRPAIPCLLEDAGDRWPGPDFEVNEFVLMQSQLHPHGSRYTPLARFPLAQPLNLPCFCPANPLSSDPNKH